MPLNGFNTSVSWSDFTQVSSRPQGVNEDAEIHAQFPFSYNMGRNGRAIIVSSADMNISMNTVTSWAVTSQQTSVLLQHEQGHYDITALGARELYNTMLTLSGASENNLKRSIRDANARIQSKVDAANRRYDNQTNHSQNTTKQTEWNKQIAAEKQKANGSIDNLPQ